MTAAELRNTTISLPANGRVWVELPEGNCVPVSGHRFYVDDATKERCIILMTESDDTEIHPDTIGTL